MLSVLLGWFSPRLTFGEKPHTAAEKSRRCTQSAPSPREQLAPRVFAAETNSSLEMAKGLANGDVMAADDSVAASSPAVKAGKAKKEKKEKKSKSDDSSPKKKKKKKAEGGDEAKKVRASEIHRS